MDLPLPPGWTPTRAFICICFRLLQNSQPQPCARSCRWSSGTFDILPRSPPSGRSGCCCSVACTSYLCTTVNSLQQLQILVWRPTGTPPQADESKPGRVGHISIPEPQAKHTELTELTALNVSYSADFSQGPSHLSERYRPQCTSHTRHPGWEVPVQDGVHTHTHTLSPHHVAHTRGSCPPPAHMVHLVQRRVLARLGG